jgi:hypothetical protein
MSPNSDVGDQPGTDRVNELYWDSDRTVGDITDELGLSRNALYTAIHPLAAGASCADCGERMVYTNRTRRDSKAPICRSCGSEGALGGGSRLRDEGGGTDAGRGNGDPRTARLAAGPPGWTRWRDELASVEPERFALVGGAAALGAVLGAAAAHALRDRG